MTALVLTLRLKLSPCCCMLPSTDMCEIVETRPSNRNTENSPGEPQKKKSSKTKGKDSKKDSKGDAKAKTDEDNVKADELDYYVHYSECTFI